MGIEGGGGGIFRDFLEPNATQVNKADLQPFIAGGGVATKPSIGPLAIEILARRVRFQNASIVYTAVPSVVVPDNSLTFVYADLDGGAGPPTVDQIGPGAGQNALIYARVTSAGGTITDIEHVQEYSPNDGVGAGNSVKSVGTVPPIFNSGTAVDPIINISPADGANPGSFSAADFNKLAGIEPGAQVVNLTNVQNALIPNPLNNDETILKRAGGVLAAIQPGNPGDVLQNVAGVLQFASLLGLNFELLHARSSFSTAGAPLGYDAFHWNQLAIQLGAINIAGDTRQINLVTPGTYLVWAMSGASAVGAIANEAIISPSVGGFLRSQAILNYGGGQVVNDCLSHFAALNVVAPTTLSVQRVNNYAVVPNTLLNQILILGIV